MPFYEYKCKECNALEEHYQKITSRMKRKCKTCGKPKLERIIGAPFVIFKGPGFYENDYKKSN